MPRTAQVRKVGRMLFKNIGLIDENFEYKENMYVGTNCHNIVYIDSKPPENEEAFFETYDGTGKVLMPVIGEPYNAPRNSIRGLAIPLRCFALSICHR